MPEILEAWPSVEGRILFNFSTASLDKDFKDLLATKVSSEFSRKFVKENNTYAAKLANSWINTINKAR